MSQDQNDTCAPPGPDATPFETMNAETIVMRLCDLLGVPLVDLVKTVEALPRWAPVEGVKDGTVFYASARPVAFYVVTYKSVDSPCVTQTMDTEWREHLRGGYVLLGGLYPKPPKVSP